MIAATLAPEHEIDELTHSIRSELFERVIDQQTAQPSETQLVKMMRYADIFVAMGGTHEDFYRALMHLVQCAAERQLGLDRATDILADIVAI